MAQLYYGGSSAFEMPDRVLAHLKVVAATKLRRGESFTVSWAVGEHRETIWLQPSISLRFVFSSSVAEQLDRELLNDMAQQAGSSAGLTLHWDAPDSAPAAHAAVETV